MSKKYSTDDNDQKEYGSKYVLSKFDFELFDEKKNVPNKIIRVKRITLPNKNEHWKIYDNTKLIFTLEGTKISVKERNFLKTSDGLTFLIDKAKTGISSLRNLRIEMKEIMDKKTL